LRRCRLHLDSQDDYVGQDFNATSAGYCSTKEDYDTDGGCAPTIEIGTENDTEKPNAKIKHARQHKVGYPIMNDWRWRGENGTFMVFTTGGITGCSSVSYNHGYAVWDGSEWQVQYKADGCPKHFGGVQAMAPMHLGADRYKIQFGNPAITKGKRISDLPFLGDTAEGYIDDFSLFTPTFDLDYQVQYVVITDGINTPFAAVAVLRNH
jgi:hypothetical protein